jgi:hypothetical protein
MSLAGKLLNARRQIFILLSKKHVVVIATVLDLSPTELCFNYGAITLVD